LISIYVEAANYAKTAFLQKHCLTKFVSYD
jgi:hypothetical protein